MRRRIVSRRNLKRRLRNVPPARRSLFSWFRLTISETSSLLSFLRKVTLDLAAIAFALTIALVFASAMLGRVIIVEALVPKALEDRGITADLLIQKLEARTHEIQDSSQTTRKFLLGTLEDKPMTVAAAGVYVSLERIVLAIEQTIGLEPRQKLTMSFVCETSKCELGAFSLHIATISDRVVAGVPILFDKSGNAKVEEVRNKSLIEPPEKLKQASEDSCNRAQSKNGNADTRVDVLAVATEAAAKQLFEGFDPFTLGVYYVRESQIKRARAISEKMISQTQDQTRVMLGHNLRGIVEVLDCRDNVAIEHLEEALKIDPHFLPATINLGTAYFNAKEYGKAMKYFLAARGRGKEHAVVHSNLGRAFFQRCEWGKAEASYLQARERGAADLRTDWTLHALSELRSQPGNKALIKDELLRGFAEAKNTTPSSDISDIDDLLRYAKVCLQTPPDKLWTDVTEEPADAVGLSTSYP